jgi:hypothetical protein
MTTPPWTRGPALKMKYTLRSYLLFPFIGQDRRFLHSYPYHVAWWLDLRAMKIRWSAARAKYPGEPFQDILGNEYKSKWEAIMACERDREYRNKEEL